MSIIVDSYNPQAVMLTATQKGILAIIHNAPTPEAAFEAINGSPALITARNLLERLNLIVVADIRAALTQQGKIAITANNLADETGQITDEGTALIDAINVRRTDKVAENFEFLKSISS